MHLKPLPIRAYYSGAEFMYFIIFFTGTFAFILGTVAWGCKREDFGNQILCPLLTVSQALHRDHTGKSPAGSKSAGGGKEPLPVMSESAF